MGGMEDRQQGNDEEGVGRESSLSNQDWKATQEDASERKELDKPDDSLGAPRKFHRVTAFPTFV